MDPQKILRTDGGTEFKGPSQAFCEGLHMKRELILADSPQFKGCVERVTAKLESTSPATRRRAKSILQKSAMAPP